MSTATPTPLEARKKLEHYCAYQERCHKEVSEKLYSLGVASAAADEIIVYLINNNFLNEERFAQSFARGKHRIKHWGKIRIVNELKFRNISQYNINTALKEIDPDEYLETFNLIATQCWNSLNGSSLQAKKKKCFDFLYRKGYETQLIYEKLDELN
ncbi:regulatory protein RecX [Flavobacterium sp.]|uniref:regulatory protein RecX n=1 Tax=Flavobacterium sp. TaxID=239 RepID=UPI0039E72B4B